MTLSNQVIKDFIFVFHRVFFHIHCLNRTVCLIQRHVHRFEKFRLINFSCSHTLNGLANRLQSSSRRNKWDIFGFEVALQLPNSFLNLVEFSQFAKQGFGSNATLFFRRLHFLIAHQIFLHTLT